MERGESSRGASSPPFDLRESWVDGPAGRLFSWDGGEGEVAVVLVHGLAGSLRHWRYQLSFLWRRRRALALDLRGHGRSDEVAASKMTVDGLADDLEAVIEAHGLERVVLVGHSLGALVTVAWAGRSPRRVAGLVLVDPSGDSSLLPTADVDALLAAVAADPRTEFRFNYRQFLVGAEEETRRLVLEDLEDTAEPTLVGGLEAAMRFRPLPALDRYEGPKLCLISPLNTLPYSLPRLRPELPTVPLPGTSHWLMIDRPDEVNEHLEALVEPL